MQPHLEPGPDMDRERSEYWNTREEGGFEMPNGDWHDMLVRSNIGPDRYRTLVTEKTVKKQPPTAEPQALMDHMADWSRDSAVFAATLGLDRWGVLKERGYDVETHTIGESMRQHDITTPPNERISSEITASDAPINVLISPVSNDRSPNNVYYTAHGWFAMPSGVWKVSIAQAAMNRGIFFQTLNPELAQNIQQRAEEAHTSGSGAIYWGTAADIDIGCRTETVYHALQVINARSGDIGKVLQVPRSQWSAPLESLVNRLTPLISGQHKVERLNAEEKEQVVLYMKHIAEFFRISGPVAVQTQSVSTADGIG